MRAAVHILKKIGKPLLRIGLPLAIIAFFVLQVKNDWNVLTAHSFQWNPWLLALAFLGFVLQEMSFGLIWQTVLARLGIRLNLRTCLRIYLASEFVRYIPGNVWHVLTRILWVGKYGVSRPIAFASMTIELITKLASGGLIFALSLLFWPDLGSLGGTSRGPLFVALGVAAMLAVLVGLHPRILGGMLNFALRVLKRDPVVLALRYRDILFVTLAWCVSWLVAGTAFYVLVLALLPATPLAALPICIGIYALAWDIGFLAFITPSGLGFREGTIAGLFALSLAFLPAGFGLIIAFLSRLVSTLAELLCVTIAYVSGGRQMREVQQAQGSRASLSEKAIREEDAIRVPDDSTHTASLKEAP
ncbi:MAG: flippase-like domain-containing protein [Ktedonobacteraceae bacterium]|nr:flippase-like domain-containing protein [Ktedonobacteraceae bacterium]